ncbi:MAG: nitrilase-related carbon-nitrogen hydrolase [Flavobacteriales bacterium]
MEIFLNIAVIQFDIVWENPDQNLMLLSRFIATIDQTDVIVLPEMFSTGFSMKPQLFDTQHQKKVMQWMQNIIETKKCAVCGSIIFKEHNVYYNRFIWMDETGQTIFYDKVHLFSLVGEEKIYQKGINPEPIIHYKNWKILPQICYDLRFPESARNKSNYDLLLYVSNWPEVRSYAWNTLLKARAIENLVYTIACNRVGKDRNGIFHSGDSQIISFDGIVLNKAQKGKTQMIQSSLSKENLLKFRKQFPFLEDIL